MVEESPPDPTLAPPDPAAPPEALPLDALAENHDLTPVNESPVDPNIAAGAWDDQKAQTMAEIVKEKFPGELEQMTRETNNLAFTRNHKSEDELTLRLKAPTIAAEKRRLQEMGDALDKQANFEGFLQPYEELYQTNKDHFAAMPVPEFIEHAKELSKIDRHIRGFDRALFSLPDDMERLEDDVTKHRIPDQRNLEILATSVASAQYGGDRAFGTEAFNAHLQAMEQEIDDIYSQEQLWTLSPRDLSQQILDKANEWKIELNTAVGAAKQVREDFLNQFRAEAPEGESEAAPDESHENHDDQQQSEENYEHQPQPEDGQEYQEQ